MNKVLFKILLISVVFSLILPVKINAETLQSMYSKLSELENQKEKVSNGKTLTQTELNNLKSEITNINNNITNIENDIKKTEENIANSEKKINDKKDQTNEMLKYLQISNGNSSYLDYIFKASSYTDLIYRYSTVTRMSNYNNSLIEELSKLIKELDKEKKKLNTKQSSLSEEKSKLSVKMSTLNANMKQLTEEGTSIEDDIKSLKQDINKYEKLGCSKTEQVNACIIRDAEQKAQLNNQKKSTNSSNSTKSSNSGIAADGWTLPIKSAQVTSQFQVVRTDCIDCGGSSHRGIDLAVAEGTPVYAAANGEVASVITSGSSLYCGGIKVYIYHIVGGKLYTTVYMHLLKANVSYGQQVTPSTVIGYSGGWSTSTKSGKGYDECTTGAHLHFGVAYNQSVVNFNSNAFNPRNLSILTNASNDTIVSR